MTVLASSLSVWNNLRHSLTPHWAPNPMAVFVHLLKNPNYAEDVFADQSEH